VVFAVALQTLKLVAIAVVLVRKPTGSVTALLAGVLRGDLLNRDSIRFGFIFGICLNTTVRPLLEFLVVADPLADIL